jgi:tRNA A-37 threonylcarbamoyl transferase component Bud32/SAM-dependent methyltransferase
VAPRVEFDVWRLETLRRMQSMIPPEDPKKHEHGGPDASSMERSIVLFVCKAMMASVIKRIRQLLSHDTRDLLWLGYVVGIAPWVHRGAVPVHLLLRWQVRRRRRHDLAHRMELLRARIARRSLPQGSYRVALAELCPELDEICRALRHPNEEITLADIDQDGFLRPRFEQLWAAPCVDANAFLPRGRFELAVVDRDGWIGARKDFRGSKLAFVNELEAALDLAAADCHVPAVLGVDFERLSITFAYINGAVVREALAQAGAPMRDRDLRPRRVPLASRRIEQERRAAGRRLVDRVLDHETIARVGKGLLAIHRAGYTLEDVKYGNIIIEAMTSTPYFVDCELALPLRQFPRTTATYLRDRDAEKLNRLFGTDLLTAKLLRRVRLGTGANVYSPFYAGAGIWWGAIWNPDLGVLRWRHILAKHMPIPYGGRVLDLGANNGFNALQMLRAGAKDVAGVEIDPAAIEQGLFVKRVFEWADNTEYRFSYIHGSHGDIGAMSLGRFDLVTALCTLYYLSAAAMAKTVSELAKLTDTLVVQCNNERSIGRNDDETYTKASLQFNVELLRSNGFPNITVIEPRGSGRPLVIARTR